MNIHIKKILSKKKIKKFKKVDFIPSVKDNLTKQHKKMFNYLKTNKQTNIGKWKHSKLFLICRSIL